MTFVWSDIVAECGKYKDRFVSTYLSYAGEHALEDDGRVTVVSERTFAEHNGIPRETFRRWLKNATDPTWATPAAKAARTAKSHATVVKNMAHQADPQAIVDAIELAGAAALKRVLHELKLRNEGVDTSKAARKA